jgi:hypothetical protein
MSFLRRRNLVVWAALVPLVGWIFGDTPAAAHHFNPNPAGVVSTFLPGAPVSADELAAILGVYVWKFELALPDGNYRVGVSVMKQGRHGSASPIGAGLVVPVNHDTPTNLTVAIVPVGGTISDASQVRVVIEGLGAYSATTIDKPVEGMAIGLPEKPEKPDPLTYVLMGGFRGHTVSSPVRGNADRLILLNFQSQMIVQDTDQN